MWCGICSHKGDGLIPDELKKDLIASVFKLENVSDSEKDWHPGSNHQVGFSRVPFTILCAILLSTVCSMVLDV